MSVTRTNVVLAGTEIELRRPDSYTIRAEVVALDVTSWLRARGAALGYCWGARKRAWLATTPAACRHDAAVYGQRIIDGLVARGVPMREILEAGLVASKLCAGGLPTEQEVADAEDFSDPVEAPSTE